MSPSEGYLSTCGEHSLNGGGFVLNTDMTSKFLEPVGRIDSSGHARTEKMNGLTSVLFGISS